MSKKISVIIPAYNIESYVERCLDSVCNQTYDNLEIIIIDDGSTDGTGQILDEYKEKDDRLLVIHKKNGGVSSARNAGLEIATGDYIGFVDGDDVVEAKMYKTLVQLIEENDADIAHCGYQMVFPNRVDYYYNTGQKKIQNREEGLYDLLEGRIIEPALVTKLYQRELFYNIKIDETIKNNEDLLLNFELFSKSKKSIYYDITPYSYMIRATSATATNRLIEKNTDALLVFEKIIASSSIDCVKSIAYKRYIYLLMMICRQNSKEKEYLKFQKEKEKVLKRQVKTRHYKNIKDKKLKMMVTMVLYCPWLFHFIYWLYDKKTGTSKKYQVEE